MSPPPKLAKLATQEITSSYPPCLFSTPEEKRLYNRLREIYAANSHSWDADACNAWPFIVEHASLAPSTVTKITNHSIARNMVNTGVTWAHIVALRVIYKAQLYRSKKIMKLIRAKYPRVTFTSFVYSNTYKLPIKLEDSAEAEEPAVEKPSRVNGDPPKVQGGGESLSRKAHPVNNPEVGRKVGGFLNEGNSLETDETESPYFTRNETLPTLVKKEADAEEQQRRDKRPDSNNDRRLHKESSKKKKRLVSKTAQDDNEAEIGRKRRCPSQPTGGATSNLATHNDEAPDGSREAPDDLVAFIERLMDALAENTKANLETARELRNLLQERRSRKGVSKNGPGETVQKQAR